MFRVKVTPVEGPDAGKTRVIDVRYGDAYVWEKTGKGRSLPSIAGALPAVPMYELALIASKRLGLVAQDVTTDDWATVNECVPIDPDEAEEADTGPDPTQETASPTDSSG